MKDQLVDPIRMLDRAGSIDHNGHASARSDAGTLILALRSAVLASLEALRLENLLADVPLSLRHLSPP